jgi:hypothetical protein
MGRNRIAVITAAGMWCLTAAAGEPAAPVVKLFPDAPPPPVVLGLPDFCCTSAGRFAFVNPDADGNKRQEGEACVAQSDAKETVAGKACF